MARKPNYSFDRMERERADAKKARLDDQLSRDPDIALAPGASAETIARMRERID